MFAFIVHTGFWSYELRMFGQSQRSDSARYLRRLANASGIDDAHIILTTEPQCSPGA